MSPIAAVRLRPYALGLKRPWRMAGAVLDRRLGLVVEVETKEGRRGFGDCPRPLPDQAEDGAAARLGALARAATGLDPSDALARLSDTGTAGAALECALLDLVAQGRGLPLARLLDPAASSRLAVNAVATAEGVGAAVANGFRVVKIKVGHGDPVAEAAVLNRLTIPPGVSLRLDANRAWGWDEAVAFVDAVAGLAVESLEEPLRAPSLERLAALQARAAFDLAIDESLPEFGADAVIGRCPVRRLVLKPALAGGLRAAQALARRAQAAGMACVVTTALDSAVGVAAAAHLAAAVGGGLAHGLATSDWLAEDVAPPFTVHGGSMVLPDRPGLGLSVAREAP